MATAEKITQVINAIRSLSGVGICFYDLNTFFHYSKLGEQNNRGHYCEFCRHVRLLEGGRAACDRSDRTEAITLAKNYQKPFFFKCHMGTCELILPLLSEKELIGLIFIGQCRIKGEDADTEIARRAERLGGAPERFVDLYHALPLFDRDELLDVGTILMQYFANLIELEGKDWIRQIATEASGIPMERIAEYIRTKYMSPITPRGICEKYHLNPSYVAREFKKHTGFTLTAYIHQIRVQNATRLLTSSKLPIESIALNVGFDDANYFSRVFKKIVGAPPEIYRATHSQKG
ncbi:MAG: helix-turn-helix domain-containing protein [Ruminococcaceae bacterium]|nr:helix-turn-helix domain-containing protein [Oscillospiraceae bacterium]